MSSFLYIVIAKFILYVNIEKTICYSDYKFYFIFLINKYKISIDDLKKFVILFK